MFISFANFYQHFIQDFSKIAILLTSLLKITRSSRELALKAFNANNNKVVSNNSNKANKTVIKSFKNNKSRNLMYISNNKAIKNLPF